MTPSFATRSPLVGGLFFLLLGLAACAGRVDDTAGVGANLSQGEAGQAGDAGQAGQASQGGQSGGTGEGGAAASDPAATKHDPPSTCAAPTSIQFAGDSGGGAPGPGCPCTRRPGPGSSFQCVAGVGESTSATIGPAGGSITLVGQEGGPHGGGVPFRIDIPPTALDHEVTITITETSVPPLASLVDYSPVYRLEPADLTFAVPATLGIPWSNESGQVSQSLSIYWAAGCGGVFEPLADNYINAGFNQGSTTKLGWAVVGYPKGAALASCP